MIDWKFIARRYWRGSIRRARESLGMQTIIEKKREDGFKIYYFAKARFPSPAWFNEKGWETFDVALSLKGDVAIDVGAHVGGYSMRLAKNFDRVFAFEPEPRAYGLLEKNLRINKIANVVTERLAVSDRSRWSAMRVASNCSSGSTLSENHYDWLEFDDQTIKVRCTSLDDYFKGFSGRIGFVKIDAEGHELAVLNGMKRLIKCSPSMILSVEVHRAPDSLTSCDCNVCQWLRIEGLKTELHGRYTSDMKAHWIVAR